MNIQTKAVLTFTQEDIINALLAYAESQGFEASDKDVVAQDIPEELALVIMSKPEALPGLHTELEANSSKSGAIPAPSEAKVTEVVSNHLSQAPHEPKAQGVLVSEGSEPSTQTNEKKRTRSIFDDDVEDVPSPKKVTTNLFA